VQAALNAISGTRQDELLRMQVGYLMWIAFRMYLFQSFCFALIGWLKGKEQSCKNAVFLNGLLFEICEG
jgi:membrane protein required for beta-lactamase induction